MDVSELHNDIREVTEILRWVLMGVNNSFLQSIGQSKEDIQQLKKKYIEQLKKYLMILKNGL